MLERQLPLHGLDERKTMRVHLPYSNLDRFVEKSGFIEQAIQNLPLERLRGIKTLGFLFSYVGSSAYLQARYIAEERLMNFKQTRFDHSVTAALVTEAILKQNGFPQEDVNAGIIAGLIHDIATPACGDPIKKLDPIALDEETHWWETLGEKGQAFITGLGISRETLDKIIKNEGIVGQVLDIADRVTYTMQDANAIAQEQKQLLEELPLSLEPYLVSLRYIFSQYPKIGNIYEQVGVDRKKQEVFFNNPKYLQAFLLLRADLHKNLYLNHTNQGQDAFLTELIKLFYSREENSLLNPQKLRSMTDGELLSILKRQYELHPSLFSPYDMDSSLQAHRVGTLKFKRREEAEERKEVLKKGRHLIIAIVSECTGFDPATSYKVLNNMGKIIPFKEFNPQVSSRIEGIVEETKGFFTFWNCGSGRF